LRVRTGVADSMKHPLVGSALVLSHKMLLSQ